jgi:hypothetical protein
MKSPNSEELSALEKIAPGLALKSMNLHMTKVIFLILCITLLIIISFKF